jgi:integrase
MVAKKRSQRNGRKRLELTPMKVAAGLAARWRKKHRGRIYYFRGDYEKALGEWRQVQGRLAAEKPYRAEYEQAAHTYRTMAAWFLSQADRENHQRLMDKAAELSARFDAADNPPPLTREEKPLYGISEQGRAVWADRLKTLTSPAHQPDRTIGAAVKSFLARKLSQSEAGERSKGRYDGYRRCLTDFQDWVGKDTPMENIAAKMLLDYHSELLGKIAAEKMSRGYARDHMTAVKVFVRWAWSLELCELPRNLNSKDLTIEVPPQKIKVFTVDEIKALLAAASPALRLYLLLALNCGFTSGDIAKLQQSELDLERGYIVRKRTKTKKYEDVPTVSYRLWTETLSLLKQYRSDDVEVALLNEDGKPLKREWIGTDNKMKKTDNIRTAYERLVKKLGIKHPKPLKLLRKTGATLLASNPKYRHCDVLYLGHSPKGTAARFYSAPDQKTFDKGVMWLGQQVGRS